MQQQQQFEAELHHVLNAGAGCMTLIVLGPKSSLALLRDVADGDAQAVGVLAAADRALRRIGRRSRAAAMSCWLCDDSALWRDEPPHALGLLVPLGVTPVRIALAMAFCSCCLVDHDEAALGAAAVAKLRNEMMPDLRLLPPMMQQAGHA